ncbi:MAG: hypothetical protein LQ340_003864 [Diploschistes diacapsis]|nr:MAG: hypothetical protein LQ340_003864 [Diploschistes diacapsis]
MASSEAPSKLRIAISGGGLAGAAIANALFRQPHLDVHVYESAKEFSESGNAIGIAINAQRALSMIVPDADNLYRRVQAMQKSSTRFRTSGRDQSHRSRGEEQGYTIHRAALLRELLAPLPQESLHADKKLEKIEEFNDGSLKLQFQDSSSTVVDTLIGADGIFGSVREHILGSDPSLLVDQENPSAFAQWEHRDAPTYVKDRVCVAGDAAHAMTPWQGSGAGMAIEDAVILGTVFSAVKTREQIGNALKAYDAVRRPRTQRVAESSRRTGRILSGLEDGVRLDFQKMHDALASRWEYIYDFDLGKHTEEALAVLERLSAE